jgi:hypothetical protein
MLTTPTIATATEQHHTGGDSAGGVVLTVAALLVIALAMAGCASGVSQGYPPGSPDGLAGPRVFPSPQQILVRLDLEPEQLQPVSAVLDDAEEARADALREMQFQLGAGERQDPALMSAFRERMSAIDGRTEQRLSELLTPDQMDKYHQVVRELGQRRGGRRPPMRG